MEEDILLGKGQIKAIDRASVHRICSGQVVLTLASAVKELVENSIDAGATNVEVRLKEYGSQLIEVTDNGSGVKECDFESLTLKHHTSKLEDFSDLTNVDTFGFRGEALSSLCALSNLSIITCHENANVGSRLNYNHDGTLLAIIPTARQVGTTVILENLFSTLPVRHKEFSRNLRKEFGKMVHLLTAYCLISTNKRITCVNHSEKGRKTVILSTNGTRNIKDNIISVFSNKQASNLMEFTQCAPSETVLEEFYLKTVPEVQVFRIDGFISSSTHGEGRSTADRQFFFINGRPCDLQKVAKVVNDVYHSFNKHQYPFIFLNISLVKGSADINVTPDKRQIFIPDEKFLLAIIKTSVLQMYEHLPSVMKNCSSLLFKENKNQGSILSTFIKANHTQETISSPSSLKRSLNNEEETLSLQIFKSPRFDNPSVSNSFANESLDNAKDKTVTVEVMKTSQTACSDDFENVDSCNLAPKVSKIMMTSEDQASDKDISYEQTADYNEKLSQEGSSQKTECINDLFLSNKDIDPDLTPCTETGTMSNSINFTKIMPFKEEKILNTVKTKNYDSIQSNLLKDIFKFSRGSPPKRDSLKDSLSPKRVKLSKNNSNKETGNIFHLSCDDNSIDFIIQQHARELEHLVTGNSVDVSEDKFSDSFRNINRLRFDAKNGDKIGLELQKEVCDHEKVSCTPYVVDAPQMRKKKIVPCEFSIEAIRDRLKCRENQDSSLKSFKYRKFRSKIAPEDSKTAEAELKKEISKDMFAEMEVIGQFNLGFIITKLNEDLFIIDQHATDEKYNFEILQRDTVLETQSLLNPQMLELTAATEATLLDNMHIFEKNGFKFNVDDDSKAGQRIELVSVPVSHNWSFGKEDVDELIFVLTDNSGRMCRPSRVCQMFASRACRKSVMIGSPLTHQIMKKLVSHMGEIEQPWNCPHGRPTMRHLFSMNLLQPS